MYVSSVIYSGAVMISFTVVMKVAPGNPGFKYR